MSTDMLPPMLTDRDAWHALQEERKLLDEAQIRDYCADPARAGQYMVTHDGLTLEYAYNRVTAQTLDKLKALATACGLEDWRDRMFAGDAINNSENRAVLHTALRRPRGDSVMVDGENVMPFIHSVLDRMEKFTKAVHDGAWRGHSGKAITTVVNIGIGGSDLGPRMVCHALRNYHRDSLTVHFVSNVDGADIEAVLRTCDPHTTLFLIASKTFTTSETMMNARTARAWLLGAHNNDATAVARHFAALSTNEKAVADFGIAASNIFPFRDWVGGRYSLWSAIGLPIALCIGFDNFRRLLAGAHSMDRHFQSAELSQNIPVIMALLGIWYRNFWDAQSYAVIPYSRDMALLPAWLQQLDMESNGKAVTRDGRAVTYDTGPVVFGAPGTDSQHAFFQLIHQGTSLIPVDFIAPQAAPSSYADHHRILIANMRAQAQALMQGRPLAESGNNPQKVFCGNRPSNTIMVKVLDPYHLGQILALYEHKVFVQGIIWNINSFDQWGVELGKILAQKFLEN